MSRLLATIHTPSGNIIELHHEGGVFATRLFVAEPDANRELTPTEAQEWYRTARQCDGQLHERFPLAVKR